jgi:hypothetical protein
MEAICFCEMSVDFQLTNWGYITQNSSVHNHCSKILKFDIVLNSPKELAETGSSNATGAHIVTNGGVA